MALDRFIVIISKHPVTAGPFSRQTLGRGQRYHFPSRSLPYSVRAFLKHYFRSSAFSIRWML
jgi:hypothetical protein